MPRCGNCKYFHRLYSFTDPKSCTVYARCGWSDGQVLPSSLNDIETEMPEDGGEYCGCWEPMTEAEV